MLEHRLEVLKLVFCFVPSVSSVAAGRLSLPPPLFLPAATGGGSQSTEHRGLAETLTIILPDGHTHSHGGRKQAKRINIFFDLSHI